MPIENEVTLQYKPLSDDQKLKVREAQFQLNNTKEQAQNAVNSANQNLINVIEQVGLANGLTKEDNVEFQLVTLEFTAKK
jgi:type III secretory pathway component EscU